MPYDRKPLDYSVGNDDLPRRPVLSGRIAALIWGAGGLMVGAATVLVPYLSTLLREFKGEVPAFTATIFSFYQQWISTNVLLTSLVAIAIIPFFLTRLIWAGGATPEQARLRERLLCAALYLIFGIGVAAVIVAVLLPYFSIVNSLSR